MSAPVPTASRWNTHSRSRYPRLWDGCVGAWCPSLGVSGTRLFDYSVRQNWGTLTNMDPATDWIANRGGYALDFDGSNDRVDTTCKYAPGTGPLSVAFWWDGRDTAQYNNIVSNRPSSFNGSTDHAWLIGNGDYTVGPANTKKIGVLLYTPSNYRVYLTSAEYNAGMRHYGFASDGSAVTIYVDGVAVALGSTASTAVVGSWPNMTQEHNTSIGGSPGGEADRYANGILDDIRVYSRALHAEEWRLLARRRAIAYEPEYQPAYYTETDAGGGVAKPVLFHSYYMSQGMRP
jgi:hypothetical protein